MTIKFQCHCGQNLSATDDIIGTICYCPACGSPITVPRPPATTQRRSPDTARSSKPRQTRFSAGPKALKRRRASEWVAWTAGTAIGVVLLAIGWYLLYKGSEPRLGSLTEAASLKTKHGAEPERGPTPANPSVVAPKKEPTVWDRAVAGEIQFTGQSGAMGFLNGPGSQSTEEFQAELQEKSKDKEWSDAEAFKLRLLNAAEAQAGKDPRRRTLTLDGSPGTGHYEVKATVFRDRFSLWPSDGKTIQGRWRDIRQWDDRNAEFALFLSLNGTLQDDGSYQGKISGTILQLGRRGEGGSMFDSDLNVVGEFTLKPIPP